MVRAHVFITGRVQGVSYRYYTREQAMALGVNGWVKNLIDSRVEAVFEGEEKKVREMIAWCWDGSPSAQVSKVEVSWEKIGGEKTFEIRR